MAEDSSNGVISSHCTSTSPACTCTLTFAAPSSLFDAPTVADDDCKLLPLLALEVDTTSAGGGVAQVIMNANIVMEIAHPCHHVTRREV